jgi:hypothetical protein
MQPTTDDIKLLKKIYANGQSVHVEGNVDQRPYRRLEDLGWLTGNALTLQDVAYRLTPTGLKCALED